MLETLIQQASCFDIIHFHTDYIHFPFLRRLLVPSLTTLHSSLDESGKLFGFYRDTPVVSISNSQRNALPFMNWQETIYHGLPIDLFSFRGEQGKYLAFLGSISPEKGIEEAIIIAMRSDIPIKIAARVSSANREYFETTIAPLLKHPSVEFLGEIGDSEKNEFLGQAYALLFPINWAEPFGLVMIEAMACGTPVIAYARGAVPEIIEHGVNGFIVNDIDDAVRVIKQAGRLNRRRCRQIFEERFHVSFMTTRYLSVYERLIYKNLDVDN
jgi:glycosyltransferase involved in cell wall biosynthesis